MNYALSLGTIMFFTNFLNFRQLLMHSKYHFSRISESAYAFLAIGLSIYPNIISEQFPAIVDYSFIFMSNYLYDNHFIFGKDVVFTHGPFGFLLNPLHMEQTYLMGVIFQLGLYFLNISTTTCNLLFFPVSRTKKLFFVGLVLFSYSVASTPTNSVALSYALISTSIFLVTHQDHKFFLFFLFLFEIFTSILFLIKLNYYITFATACFSYIFLLYVTKKIKLNSALCVIALLFALPILLYLFYNNSVIDFINYAHDSFEIASYYSVSNTISVGFWVYIIPASLFFLIGFLFINLIRLDRYHIYTALLFACAMYFSFKHSFTRIDFSHIQSFFQCLFFLLSFSILFTNNKHITYFITINFVIAYLCATLLFNFVGARFGLTETLNNYLKMNIFTQLQHINNKKFGSDDIDSYFKTLPYDLNNPNANQLIAPSTEEFKNAIKGKSVASLVTTFPMIKLLYQENFRFKPFYIYETYSAYSEALDNANSNILNNNLNSPDILLYAPIYIDGKTLLTTSPATFYNFYNYYNLVKTNSGYYYFLRRAIPRYKMLKKISSSPALIDNWKPIPQSSANILAKFHTKLNVLGILSLFFGGIPAVNLYVRDINGTTITTQVSVNSISNICLLGAIPYGNNIKNLFTDNLKAQEISEISLGGEGAKYILDSYMIDFYELIPN